MSRQLIQGRMVPLGRDSVDTDTIMPQEFLKGTGSTGFGDSVFHHWRHTGQIDLDSPERSGAVVLVAGKSFGTGSSREHAVWGLKQWGFEAVIASEFGDIFASNCINNGVAPIALPEQTCRHIRLVADTDSRACISIDLAAGSVRVNDLHATFDLRPIARRMLIEGLDEIALTESLDERIEEYERRRREWMPITSATVRMPLNFSQGRVRS